MTSRFHPDADNEEVNDKLSPFTCSGSAIASREMSAVRKQNQFRFWHYLVKNLFPWKVQGFIWTNAAPAYYGTLIYLEKNEEEKTVFATTEMLSCTITWTKKEIDKEKESKGDDRRVHRRQHSVRKLNTS